MTTTATTASGSDDTAAASSPDVPLICQWADCDQLFCSLPQLVEHIEQHVDQRRTDAVMTSCGNSAVATGSTLRPQASRNRKLSKRALGQYPFPTSIQDWQSTKYETESDLSLTVSPSSKMQT